MISLNCWNPETWGGSNFLPAVLISQADKEVKMKNCSPEFVGIMK